MIDGITVQLIPSLPIHSSESEHHNIYALSHKMCNMDVTFVRMNKIRYTTLSQLMPIIKLTIQDESFLVLEYVSRPNQWQNTISSVGE